MRRKRRKKKIARFINKHAKDGSKCLADAEYILTSVCQAYTGAPGAYPRSQELSWGQPIFSASSAGVRAA